jgi:hypothetical protein
MFVPQGSTMFEHLKSTLWSGNWRINAVLNNIISSVARLFSNATLVGLLLMQTSHYQK